MLCTCIIIYYTLEQSLSKWPDVLDRDPMVLFVCGVFWVVLCFGALCPGVTRNDFCNLGDTGVILPWRVVAKHSRT